MKKITILIITILSALSIHAQSDKFFSSIPVVSTVDGSLYLLTVKDGVWKKFNVTTLKGAVTPTVRSSPILYTPGTSGNTTNLNEFVTDPGGDLYFIDYLGNAMQFGTGSGGSQDLSDVITAGDAGGLALENIGVANSADDAVRLDQLIDSIAVADAQQLTFNNGTGELTIDNGNTVIIPAAAGGDNWGVQEVIVGENIQGAGTSADTLRIEALKDYPFWYRYTNDFSVNDDGISTFNGGTFIYNGANDRIEVTASGADKGIILDYENIASTEYMIVLDIEAVSTDIKLYSKWSTLIGTYSTGQHQISFTSSATGGGFGNKVILAASSAGSFYVNNIRLVQINSNALIDKPADTEAKIQTSIFAASNILYNSSYDTSTDITSLSGFGGCTPAVTSNKLQGTAANAGAGIVVGYDGTTNFDIPEYIEIYFETETSDSLYIQPRWSNQITYMTTGAGAYHFKLKKIGDNANTQLNHITISPVSASGATIVINKMQVWKSNDTYNRNQYVEIGYNAIATQSSYPGVSIGLGANSDQSYGTSVGPYASTTYDNRFAAAEGNEVVALGEYSKGYGWRNTALGAKTHAGGQSATAVGAGAVALRSHTQAWGRGAYVPQTEINTDATTVIAGRKIYFENGWAHQFNMPISGITIDNYTPSSTEVELHGQDAFDSRYQNWNSGTSYSVGDWVQYSNGVYEALTAHTNQQPDTNADDWEFIYTTSGGVPADYNVTGGHMALYGGRGTGTGEGGEIRFYTAPENGAGENVKNGSILAGKFIGDSSITSGTRFYLLDITTGTLKQVKIGAEGTGPGGSGKALFVD